MKLPWQQATWEDSIKSNVALSFAVLAMAVISVMSVYYANQQHERIVLTPTMIDKKMTIDWQTADEEYVKSFGLSVAQMVGDMTPENATFVINSMSMFMHSSIYPDLRRKMLAVADTRQFREIASSTRYFPSGVEYEPETNKVFVKGALVISTSTGNDRRLMTYEMTIRIENGRPMIYFFDNYEGEPRTKDWLIHNKVQEKKEGEQK